MRRAIVLTMGLALAGDSVDAFAEQYHAKMLDWSWPTSPDHRWNIENSLSQFAYVLLTGKGRSANVQEG